MGKKYRGHFCKGCGRYKANEKFSGKGHHQHLCKECKKRRNRGNINDEDLYHSDETFAFIAGYTDSGVPYGVEHEEWVLLEAEENYSNKVDVTIPEMIREKLKNFSNGQAVEQSIYTSIAVSLFISNQISLEEGAHLADMIFTDFIYFLDLHNVPWSIGLKDGSEDYQKSVDHLIDFVDNILENEEKEVFLI